jgi:hypothetical protein
MSDSKSAETGRTLNILETCCFPKGCILPDDIQRLLAPDSIQKLEKAGLEAREWTRGALMHEEPYFSKIKEVVCGPCEQNECQLNKRLEPSGLFGLKNGRYHERIEYGNQLLEQLLPETRRVELQKVGIKCLTHQMPSRKNPKLLFSFTREGGSTSRVSCEIGNRRLCTNEGETALISLEQISEAIEKAINTLVMNVVSKLSREVYDRSLLGLFDDDGI